MESEPLDFFFLTPEIRLGSAVGAARYVGWAEMRNGATGKEPVGMRDGLMDWRTRVSDAVGA